MNDSRSEPLPASAHLRAKSHYLLVSLAILVADQWSKWLVETHLSRHASIEIIPGFLDFTHVQNTGVAFGLFASHGDTTGTLVLLALGFFAFAFVGYYFWMVPLEDRILLWSLALVLGGAVGNLIDRLAQGGVTDFVDVYVKDWHWHTFNIADSAISVGLGLMILGAFTARPHHQEATADDVDDAAEPHIAEARSAEAAPAD